MIVAQIRPNRFAFGRREAQSHKPWKACCRPENAWGGGAAGSIRKFSGDAGRVVPDTCINVIGQQVVRIRGNRSQPPSFKIDK